jgi:hypothetical protein
MGIKKGASWVVGPEPLFQERPRLAALLGCVANAWAVVETKMANEFQYLLSMRTLPSADDAADELFDSTNIVPQKIQLLRAVHNVRVRDEEMQRRFNAVADTVRSAYEERSRLLHSAWGVSDHPAYKESIIKVKPYRMDQRDSQPYNEAALMASILLINKAGLDLAGYFMVLRAHLRGQAKE